MATRRPMNPIWRFNPMQRRAFPIGAERGIEIELEVR